MENQELLQAFKTMLDESLKPVHAQLDVMQKDIGQLKQDYSTMKEDIAEIKEHAAETREAANTLLEWAEEAQIQVKIPLFKGGE